METIFYPKETKASKEHFCSFCAQIIKKGESYMKSTHKHDDYIYEWKTHKHCAEIAERLKMYEDADEGVTMDYFMETIHWKHNDLLIQLIPQTEAAKYHDIIEQLRHVKFKEKLMYVIRYYKKLDKDAEKVSNENTQTELPMFEVIAEYPSSIYEVGEKIDAPTENMIAFFVKYPHIFKKLNSPEIPDSCND